MADEIQGMTVKVGVTDDLFTQGIGRINKSMALLQSEFKASSEGLKGFGTAEEQANNKSEYLNKAIELQGAKVRALQESFTKSKTETGEFSNATMNAGIKVNNAVAQLSRMENELKGLSGELNKTVVEEKKLSTTEGLNKLGSGIDNAKSKISGLKTAFFGITATVASGAGLFAFSEKAISAGDNAYKLSQKLHLTTAESASLNKIFSITGTDASAFSSTMIKLDKSIEGAGEKGNATTKVLDKYGVSLTDASGKLLPMNQQLEQLAIGYKKSAEAGEEDAFSAEVLGNKGASLIPLLEGYTEAKVNASKVKGTFAIDPKEAHETEEQLKVLKLQVGALGGQFAKALIPVINEILPPMIEFFQKLAGVIGSQKDVITGFVKNILEIGKTVGGIVKPVIEGLFNFITEHGEATKNIVIGIGGAFLGFSAVRGTIDGVTGAIKLWDNAMQIKDKVLLAIEAMKKWEIVTKLQTLAQGALNLVMEMNPIGLIVIAIAALVAGIVIAYNKCEWFRDGVNAIGSWLANFFTVTLPNAFKTLVNFFQNNWKEILLFIVNPFAGAFALLYRNCDGFKTFIDGFAQNVKDFLVNGWNNIITFFTVSVPAFIESIVAWFNQLPSKIGTAIGEVLGTLAKWGVDVYTWISTNVPIWINNVVTFWSELPSKIWTWLVGVVTNITTWGVNILTYITTNVPIWIASITNFFAELPGKIWTWLVNTVTNIVTWGSNMFTKATEGMTKVYNGIVDTFTNLPAKMLEIGGNLVKGIWDGIKNSADWLMSKISDFADGIVSGFKDAFDIHSPSRIMRDLIGTNLVKGISVGVDIETPNLKNNINKNMSGVIADLKTNVNINSLKNISSSNSTDTTSTTSTLLSKVLDKMDTLADAFDISIDGQSLMSYTNNNLAISSKRVR